MSLLSQWEGRHSGGGKATGNMDAELEKTHRKLNEAINNKLKPSGKSID